MDAIREEITANYTYKHHILIDAFSDKEWRRFIDITLNNPELIKDAFSLYEFIPDCYKYELVTETYKRHGKICVEVCNALKDVRKYGAPYLPGEIAEQKEIQIYKASNEGRDIIPYNFSWTYKKDVVTRHKATQDAKGIEDVKIYTGRIKTADIIAYNDLRREKEIIQYNSVFNIEEL